MAKYDKVAYPDDLHFAGDDQEYRATGNGIYNVYTVGMSKYSDTFKIGCFRFQKRPRTYFMLGGAVVVLCIVVLALIITAASRKSTSGDQSHETHSVNDVLFSNPDPFGLIASPTNQDANGVLIIKFTQDYKSYEKFYKRLAHTVKEYSTETQVSDTDYVDCNKSMKSIPTDKACRFSVLEFGPCNANNMFGYMEGRPCVLLQLRLDPNLTPVPYTNTTALTPLNVPVDAIAPGHIAVNCAEKVAEGDAPKIGTNKEFGDPIMFHPKTGFPAFYYNLVGNEAKFLPPAVMVQFNQLETNKDIVVTCTAYAKNLLLNSKEMPKSIPLYQRNILFRVD